MNSHFTIALLFGCAVLAIFYAKNCCAKNRPLKIGMMAPDFSLLDENNEPQTLSALKGNNVVLYFYPKDFTPGCTKQACSLRDGYSEITKEGIKLFGISYDSPESHKKFKDNYQLPFSLLSDKDKKVAKAYGVKGVLFVDRATFLIDASGKIIAILKNVDVANHAQQIIDAFKKV
jgi:peroxiredoxin Q/BCP